MSPADHPEPTALEARLRAAAEMTAHARRDLARGEMPDLQQLMAVVGAIDTELGLLPASSAREIRSALVILMDEIGALAGELNDQRADVAARLRASSRHQRAGAAYRRPGTG